MLDKHSHLNTQPPLQETLLRNHKHQTSSSKPLRKLLHSILRGKKKFVNSWLSLTKRSEGTNQNNLHLGLKTRCS